MPLIQVMAASHLNQCSVRGMRPGPTRRRWTGQNAALLVALFAAAAATAAPVMTTPYYVYDAGTRPLSALLVDMNGDGRRDLVQVNQDVNSVSVRLGAGDGTLITRLDFPTAASPAA